ncbi:MAG: hypothetical protein D6801_04150 [Alphaproteobacteria bacterium]|nr:MAG: hypothetical protein D6801_04150 [Alphaproteobacteria bacterium]
MTHFAPQIVPRALPAAALLAAMAAATGAFAQDETWTCRFETLCFQSAPCTAETEIGVLTRRGDLWQYDIKGAGHFDLHKVGGPQSPLMSLVSDNVTGATALLTLFADGSARESIHFVYEGEARSTTRLGRCEAGQ